MLDFIKKHAGKGASFFALLALLGVGFLIGLPLLAITLPIWAVPVAAAAVLVLMLVTLGFVVTYLKENQNRFDEQTTSLMHQTLNQCMDEIDAKFEVLKEKILEDDPEKRAELLANLEQQLDEVKTDVGHLTGRIESNEQKIEAVQKACQTKHNYQVQEKVERIKVEVSSVPVLKAQRVPSPSLKGTDREAKKVEVAQVKPIVSLVESPSHFNSKSRPQLLRPQRIEPLFKAPGVG